MGDLRLYWIDLLGSGDMPARIALFQATYCTVDSWRLAAIDGSAYEPVQTILFSGPFAMADPFAPPHPNTMGKAWLSVLEDDPIRMIRVGEEAHLFAGTTPAQLRAFVRGWGGTVYAPEA